MRDSKIKAIASKKILVKDLSDSELLEFCKTANRYYRLGNLIVSDADYDGVFLNELKKRLPEHPFLKKIEPEGNFLKEKKVKLPKPMLSTDKAFTSGDIVKWVDRLKKSSQEIEGSSQEIKIKITPKLDGFAAYDDGKKLYTRGDGTKGTDISRVFERGLKIFKNSSRGLGAGEIVIKKSYFEKNLSKDFESSRNFQASLIKEKELDALQKEAIQKKAALFVPFSKLPKKIIRSSELFERLPEIVVELRDLDFDTDGVILEAIDEALKKHLGSNRKFHRWQIAFKKNTEKVQVTITDIHAQVGRTGKVTPVVEFKPTALSGAMIHRATAYHYKNIKNEGIGKGAVVEIVRSGLVIPKIEKVLTRARAFVPKKCPSCKKILEWSSDFLVCKNNDHCPDQIIHTIEYFFQTLGNNDLFGLATIKKLYKNGIKAVSAIYRLTANDLEEMGFGAKTSQNLMSELEKSRTIKIEDAKFLAAFGVARMGLGNCERLLRHHPIKKIFNLTLEDLLSIEGFAEITANEIIEGLKKIRSEFETLLKLNFNLEKTLMKSRADSPFWGKQIAFTGAMERSREAMEKEAKSLGVKAGKAISSKTDYLVIGERVGQKKMEAAKKHNVKVLTEKEYLQLILSSVSKT